MNIMDILQRAQDAAGAADLGTVVDMLDSVLARHKNSWVYGKGGARYCQVCMEQADPACEPFILAMAQLTIVEVLDGTRFSGSWQGPIEDRNYRVRVV